MVVTRRQTRMASSSRPAKRPKKTSAAGIPPVDSAVQNGTASSPSKSSKRKTSPTAGSKQVTSADSSIEVSKRSAGKIDNDDSVAGKILSAEKRMSDSLETLTFKSPVTHVYNPHVYAWKLHEWYVETYGASTRDILLVGMNPGPWGMAQTGVPFGQVETVRDWLKMPADIGSQIGVPEKVHDKRPIDGLDCARSEVSGRRLWKEYAEAKYTTPESFFERYFVHQYCPLMFLESSGRNRTPVQLRAAERKPLLEICDVALLQVIQAVQPKVIGGIGAFAAERCKTVVEQAGLDARVGKLLHPSPASPAANKGWVGKFTGQLDELLAGE